MQLPFVIVHLRVADVPAAIPVTAELADVAVVMLAVPLTTVQRPVPDVGAFPPRIKFDTLH